jgi:signal transduction histidine kinase
MEAGTRNRRPAAVFALVAEIDSRAGHSDPGLSRIVLTIDASGPATGYGGSTMKTAGRLQRHAFDAAVVALALVAQIEVWARPVLAPRGALSAIVVLWTVALLLRRRFPFAAPVFVFLLLATVSFADREAVSSLDTSAFALLLAFCAVGAQEEARQATAGVAIGCATVAVIIERDPRIEPSEGIQEVIAGAGLALAAFVLARRARRAAALEERAVRLEREREERERVAVAVERRRIARDLHDVVAHGVGVMTVQAGAARLLLEDDPARARGPLLAVEQAGREALGELRRLLGILRRDEREPALRPQPGLGDLDELVAQAHRAGLPVELVIQGPPPASLPAGVDLAAYRIVQEALTNTRKHAGPARASVAVRYGAEALELEITDDGRAGANGGGGHGLIGMRERVALYGGQLDAGPRPQGGFTIHAHLPLQAARP